LNHQRGRRQQPFCGRTSQLSRTAPVQIRSTPVRDPGAAIYGLGADLTLGAVAQ